MFMKMNEVLKIMINFGQVSYLLRVLPASRVVFKPHRLLAKLTQAKNLRDMDKPLKTEEGAPYDKIPQVNLGTPLKGPFKVFLRPCKGLLKILKRPFQGA